MGVAIVLLLSFAAGAVRIIRGPTRSDRMMAAQLFGTTGVAILLLLARAMEVAALLDVALVLALLATVAVVAFVQRFGHRPVGEPEQGAGGGGAD